MIDLNNRFSLRQYVENKLNVTSYMAQAIVTACDNDIRTVCDITEHRYFLNQTRINVSKIVGDHYLTILYSKPEFEFELFKKRKLEELKEINSNIHALNSQIRNFTKQKEDIENLFKLN